MLRNMNTFDKIAVSLSEIIYDLCNPNGRSIYDTFWQEDKPYYTGLFFIYTSLFLFLFQIIIYIRN